MLIIVFLDLRVPVEITDISDIDDKSASLSLHWQPRHLPQFDKVPVKYQVEAWEPRKHTWKRLASAVPDTSFRVTGLAPEDDYMFRVRAEAASLLSEPTYPISLSRFRCKIDTYYFDDYFKFLVKFYGMSFSSSGCSIGRVGTYSVVGSNPVLTMHCFFFLLWNY